MEPSYTATQGRHPVFIYYTKLHDLPPVWADMQRDFSVSPPSRHNMVVTLEKRGIVCRNPGAPRSMQTLLTRDRLPGLN